MKASRAAGAARANGEERAAEGAGTAGVSTKAAGAGARARARATDGWSAMGDAARVCVLALGLAACGPSIYETYAYGNEYDPRKHEWVIGVSDVVQVQVYHNIDLSGTGTVRPDGVITLPLIGDLLVAGKTSARVREEVKRKLAKFIKDEPDVEVLVSGFNSYRFAVAGNVTRSGAFSEHHFVTVSEALAMAGGPSKFATDRIVILRVDATGKMREIPVSYKAILTGRRPDMNLAIVAGDTLVVE